MGEREADEDRRTHDDECAETWRGRMTVLLLVTTVHNPSSVSKSGCERRER